MEKKLNNEAKHKMELNCAMGNLEIAFRKE